MTEAEQAKIIEVCNQAQFASLPPSQIVPTLLDQGEYYGSESTYYRVLKAHGQLHHRGRSLAPKGSSRPTTYTATGPCQVFCWDITYLASTVRGQFYYLYMLEDVYSVSAAKSAYLPSFYCVTFFAMGSSGTFQGSRASSFSRLSASPICAST
jgi:hypothetical protein